MVNEQILDYVRQQVAAGTPIETIKKALAKQGWNEQDINDALSTVQVANIAPPAPPAPRAPIQPASPIQQAAPVRTGGAIYSVVHIIALVGIIAGVIVMHFEIANIIQLQFSLSVLWYALPVLVAVAAALLTAPRSVSGGTRFSKALFGFLLLWGASSYFTQIVLVLTNGYTSEVLLFVEGIVEMIEVYILLIGAVGLLLTSWRIWERQKKSPIQPAFDRAFLITCCVALVIFYALPTFGSISSNSAAAFTATPTSGAAPLTVKVVTNPNKTPGGDESMDFGDGSASQSAQFFDPNETLAFAHTYTQPGTYTINFMDSGQSLGSQTITVSPGTSSSTTSAASNSNIPAAIGSGAQTIASVQCSSNLEWQIFSNDALSLQNPVNGGAPGEQCVSFALYQNGTLLFNTNPNSYCAGTVNISRTYAYHTALQQAENLSDTSIANTASQCLATNAAPSGTSGTPTNFQKTIPLPTSSGSITVFPGQTAEGTIDGIDIKLTTDATESPNLNGTPGGHYNYHLYVNGVDSNESKVGNVLIVPGVQYADGSVRWDITYPNASGQYVMPPPN